jgi:hypothetical protein
MKKLIYIVLFSFVASLTFSACTEEKVEPNIKAEAGGGAGSERP